MILPNGRMKYILILIAFMVMGSILTVAYLRNIDEETEYTRRVRHVVVNSYELQLQMELLQYTYSSYVLGHPSVSKDDLDTAYGIVVSKYDTLMLGDTHKLIHRLDGDISGLLKRNMDVFLALESDISSAELNDSRLVKINSIIEEQLLDDVR